MTTMTSALRRAEQVGPDDQAVSCGAVRLTYAEMAERCRRLGGALHGLGLQRGDRVAVIGPNCHRYLELYVGVPGAGLVVVPLNARHNEAELQYALQDAGVRVVFAGIAVGELPSCVQHVFDLGDAYESLLAHAEPIAFVADVPRTSSPGCSIRAGRPGRRRA